jgi:AcrR family transcriptional regulator
MARDATRDKRREQALIMFGTGTRGRILRGTAQSVVKRGVRGCTVQNILDAAEVSRRTFYKFFDSAEDVLDALFEVSTRMLAGTIQMAAEEADDPIERIERAVDAYLELQEVGGRLTLELHCESMRPDSQLGPRRARLMNMLVELLRANIAPLHEGPIDPLALRGMLLSLEGLTLFMLRQGEDADFDRDRIRHVYLDMLKRALGL